MHVFLDDLNRFFFLPFLKINEGKIPEDRLALQMLAEELTAWPNLEVFL